MAIIGTVGAVVVLITRAAAQRPVIVQPPPHLLPPPQVTVILRQLPGYQAEIVDGQWIVANEREWMTIDDASRLITGH